MRILYLIPMLIFAAPVGANDVCDDLWFSRNSIFDSYGHCFQSPLGKSVFDNSNCTGQARNLSEFDKSQVAKIRTVEKQYGCSIDTSKTKLDIANPTLRALLTQQPIADETESACLNYLDEIPIALYAGPSVYTTPIGQISRGANVLYGHQNYDGWDFIVASKPSGADQIGWTNEPIENCEAFAG